MATVLAILTLVVIGGIVGFVFGNKGKADLRENVAHNKWSYDLAIKREEELYRIISDLRNPKQKPKRKIIVRYNVLEFSSTIGRTAEYIGTDWTESDYKVSIRDNGTEIATIAGWTKVDFAPEEGPRLDFMEKLRASVASLRRTAVVIGCWEPMTKGMIELEANNIEKVLDNNAAWTQCNVNQEPDAAKAPAKAERKK